jgi:hypothetical protein
MVGGVMSQYTVETPTDVENPESIIIAPGFFGIEAAYGPLRHMLASELGMQAITVRSPRGLSEPGSHSIWHPERLMAKAIWGVIRNEYSHRGNTGYHVVGHSMSGPAIVAATEHIIEKKGPDFVESVTLLASAGATPHNVFDLARRGVREIRRDIIPNIRIMREMLKDAGTPQELLFDLMSYGLHTQTVREALNVTRSDVRSGLHHLSEHGVKSYGIFFNEDEFFPGAAAEKHIKPHLSGFVRMPGVHVLPQIEPLLVAHTIDDVVHGRAA